MGSSVLSHYICNRKGSKRGVPKIHHEQLCHNYLKVQSQLVLQCSSESGHLKNGQVRQQQKCNRKRQKSLSLQSLMQGDSSSQYPKNAGRGVLLKPFSQMKWKGEAPDLMLLKKKNKIKSLNDNCYTFVDKGLIQPKCQNDGVTFLTSLTAVDKLPLLLISQSMKCCWKHIWVALHRLGFFLMLYTFIILSIK